MAVAFLRSLAQDDVLAMRTEDDLRTGAEKRVAGELAAFFHRFKKEGVVARVDLVEGGDGGLHVGDDFAVDRDQVSPMGEFAKAFAGQGVRRLRRNGRLGNP